MMRTRTARASVATCRIAGRVEVPGARTIEEVSFSSVLIA